MFALGFIARKLWHVGKPIWEVLGNQYGLAVRRTVAILSLTWMSGVLAAQIHGSVAVLSTAGFTRFDSVLVTTGALVAISSIDLGIAALLFAACLLASNLILLHALVTSEGLPVYLHAWPSFIRDIRTASPVETLASVIAIGFLVISGSDYQQFVIAARRPVDAWLGCVLAGLFLIAAGFLPAATVVATLRSGKLSGLSDSASAIPWIMLHASGSAGPLCLGVIVLAALGSGTAITRAMSSALMDLHPIVLRYPISWRILIVVLCSAIAVDGQTIVSTIISLNMVYISAVGILFVLNQAEHPVTPRCASTMMISGAAGSLLAAALDTMHIADVPGWTPLAAGLLASAFPLLAWHLASKQRDVRS